MIRGYDILCLSTQDWDSLPTRKHRFMRWFAETGNRVLYVEQQMHLAGWLVDIRHQFSRVWRWLQGPREVEPNLWVFTMPIVLPFFQMSVTINQLNNAFLLPVLRSHIKKLGFKNLIFWTYTPHSGDFVGRLGERAAVYECVDEFTATKGLVSPSIIDRLERALVGKVDLVSVTGEGLYPRRSQWARRIEVIPNGAEVNHFSKAADPATPLAEDIAALPRPIVGYLGVIQYWIDTALLARIAKKHTDWSVVLIGPPGLLADLKPLEGIPNVHLLGLVPYEKLPQYFKGFDVCVNPYVMDGIAEGCSPLKLYEYLATGKPIVSVDMPEARRFAGLIRIARDSDDFIAQVEAAIDTDDGLTEKRLQEAQKHSWRSRFEHVSAVLAEVLEAKENHDG